MKQSKFEVLKKQSKFEFRVFNCSWSLPKTLMVRRKLKNQNLAHSKISM